MAERPERTAERLLLEQVVAHLPEARLAEARDLLLRHFGRRQEARSRGRRIALIGLRGAGKSTLGQMLARRLGIGFVELDREVEREGRMELSDIFAVHGQEGFRRLEREALQLLVREGTPAVIAAGGGIAAEPATFEFLLDTCVTVWLRASPEEHMRRVVEQGDTRPMRDSKRAMDDLARHPGQPGSALRQGRRDRRHFRAHAGRDLGGAACAGRRRPIARRGLITT